MPWVVSYAGQKGGVGKSILSQGYAVTSVRAGDSALLVDLDVGQRSTLEWGQWRRQNRIEPAIDVRLVDPDKEPDFGRRQAGPDVAVLIFDAPGWSDERTLLLAGCSDLLVVPTGASVSDLRPTIRLIHELQEKGMDARRIITTLAHVRTESEIKFASEYLVAAGCPAVTGLLRETPDYRVLQNKGLSIVEGKMGRAREEAETLLTAIRGCLLRERGNEAQTPLRAQQEVRRLMAREQDHGR